MIGLSIATIFISLNHPVVLVFDEPIDYLTHGAKQGTLRVQKSKNSKIITLNALGRDIDTSMHVITGKRSYDFFIKHSESTPHHSIKVEEGKRDGRYEVVINNKRYKLLEGRNSLHIINKMGRPLKVNERSIKKSSLFSKGIPLFIEGRRVLN